MKIRMEMVRRKKRLSQSFGGNTEMTEIGYATQASCYLFLNEKMLLFQKKEERICHARNLFPKQPLHNTAHVCRAPSEATKVLWEPHASSPPLGHINYHPLSASNRASKSEAPEGGDWAKVTGGSKPRHSLKSLTPALLTS